MSLKKELLELITTILNNNRAGVKFSWNENKQTRKLKSLLEKTDQWSNMVSKSTMFQIMWRSHRGRKYKSFNILIGDKKIPITKTMIRKMGTKPKTKRTKVLEHMRFLIEDQMINEKRKQLRQLQKLNDYRLIPKEYHLDHVIPFIKLAVEWAKSHGYKSFDDTPGRSSYGETWIFPDAIQTSWREFHLEQAELELLPAKVNLSEGSKNYKPEF